MRTLPPAPSSTAAQPSGALPWVSSGAVRGERRWFLVSASVLGVGPTETDFPLHSLSLPAGGAVDSYAPGSVATAQKASPCLAVGGSSGTFSSNISVKRTRLRRAAYLAR